MFYPKNVLQPQPVRGGFMKHWYDLSATLLTCALLTLASSTGVAAVKGEEVDYSDGNIHMTGYIAYDDSIEGKRPGVTVHGLF
jgi:hypothetical protein